MNRPSSEETGRRILATLRRALREKRAAQSKLPTRNDLEDAGWIKDGGNRICRHCGEVMSFDQARHHQSEIESSEHEDED